MFTALSMLKMMEDNCVVEMCEPGVLGYRDYQCVSLCGVLPSV
jgi:hypothetical protein